MPPYTAFWQIYAPVKFSSTPNKWVTLGVVHHAVLTARLPDAMNSLFAPVQGCRYVKFSPADVESIISNELFTGRPIGKQAQGLVPGEVQFGLYVFVTATVKQLFCQLLWIE